MAGAEPLWRAIAVYRFASIGYAVLLAVINRADYSRPAVAAAADYWFRGGIRPAICRALCAAFPVRRSGGGSADLAAAARLLAAGHDVIVFPEGTRSRDGRTGDFHRGAARLAAAAGAPLVPAGISGTRTLLPPGVRPRLRRSAVTVRFGVPLLACPLGGSGTGEAMAEARARVVTLVALGGGCGTRLVRARACTFIKH